jgi:hypothetical protein
MRSDGRDEWGVARPAQTKEKWRSLYWRAIIQSKRPDASWAP